MTLFRVVGIALNPGCAHPISRTQEKGELKRDPVPNTLFLRWSKQTF